MLLLSGVTIKEIMGRHILVFQNLFPSPCSFSIWFHFFKNTLTYFFMLRSQRKTTTTIIGYYQIRKLCVLIPMTFNSLTSLFIQNIGLYVLLSRPHDRKYIMYMRNLFLLPFVVLLQWSIEKRDDKFVKDGVGWQREHRTVVVWCFFLLCLVSIIEKGEELITWIWGGML